MACSYKCIVAIVPSGREKRRGEERRGVTVAAGGSGGY